MDLDLIEDAFKTCRRRYHFSYSWGSFKLLTAVTLLFVHVAQGRN